MMLQHFGSVGKRMTFFSLKTWSAITMQNNTSTLPRKIISDLVTRNHKTYFIVVSPKIPSKLLDKSISRRTFGSRHFHTSEKRRALPPYVLFILRPIVKLMAMVLGRSIRKWWKALPQDKRSIFIDKMRKNKTTLTGCAALLMGSGIHFYVSHLEQDPITKRWRFIIFSPEQVMQISQLELELQIEEYKDNVLKKSHLEYVRVIKVANRILQANYNVPGIQNKDWAVTVVDHPILRNAFVLPNGNIFIFTKMLSDCDNDDQLGMILAHEMSHAILSHMAEQMSNDHLVEWLLLVPIVLLWAVLPDGAALFSQWVSERIANFMFHLPFSRAIEIEADIFGLELAAKACFDVREAIVFWNKMHSVQGNDVNSNTSMEWLSTHPSFERRGDILNNYMPAALELRNKCGCSPLLDNSSRRSLKVDKNIPKKT